MNQRNLVLENKINPDKHVNPSDKWRQNRLFVFVKQKTAASSTTMVVSLCKTRADNTDAINYTTAVDRI
jgi:hypothetical protein